MASSGPLSLFPKALPGVTLQHVAMVVCAVVVAGLHEAALVLPSQSPYTPWVRILNAVALACMAQLGFTSPSMREVRERENALAMPIAPATCARCGADLVPPAPPADTRV
jgi:hypothetical protein